MAEDGTQPRQDSRLGLLEVAIAAVVAVAISPGHFSFWSLIIGVTLFIVLIAFDRPVDRPVAYKRWENLAFACVYAICVILMLGVFLEVFWDLEWARNLSTWLPPADTVYPSEEELVAAPEGPGEAAKKVRADNPTRVANLEQSTIFVIWLVFTVLVSFFRRRWVYLR